MYVYTYMNAHINWSCHICMSQVLSRMNGPCHTWVWRVTYEWVLQFCLSVAVSVCLSVTPTHAGYGKYPFDLMKINKGALWMGCVTYSRNLSQIYYSCHMYITHCTVHMSHKHYSLHIYIPPVTYILLMSNIYYSCQIYITHVKYIFFTSHIYYSC